MGQINHDPYSGGPEVAFYALCLLILIYFLPILVTLAVLAPLVLKVYVKLSAGLCQSVQRIDGKTVIITGANVGIGLETAKDLARRGGRIILACRNQEKGKAALEEVKRDARTDNVVLKELDLSSLKSVRRFCKEIKEEESRLDILINNAGTTVLAKTLTEDKLEMCMQANHFGPFLLTNLLLDLMQKTGKSRIVNVSSMAHLYVQSIDSENWNSEKSFGAIRVYALSKLANIYFTTELSRRLKAKGIQDITVNAVHPGVVRTSFFVTSNEVWYIRIINPILYLFYKTANEGAQTSIHAAVSERLEGVSGGYFEDCAPSRTSKLGKDAKEAEVLWNLSVGAVRLLPEDTIVAI